MPSDNSSGLARAGWLENCSSAQTTAPRRAGASPWSADLQRSSGGSFSRWLRLRGSTYSRFPLWGRNSHRDLIRRRDLLVSQPFSTLVQVRCDGTVTNIEQSIKKCALDILEAIDPHALALYHRTNGDVVSAQQLIDRCLSNQDKFDDVWALNLRGSIAREERRFSDAEDAYKLAVMLNPAHAIVYANWRFFARISKDSTKASRSAGSRFRSNQNPPEPTRNGPTSCDCSDTTLKRSRNAAWPSRSGQTTPALYVLLGLCLMQQGRPLEAIEKYKMALLMEPNAPWIMTNWGDVLRQMRDFQGAAEKFAAALATNDRYYQANHSWGRMLMDEYDFQGAREKFEKALEINPRFEWTLASLASFFRLNKEFDKAEAEIRKALAVNSSFPDGFVHWANILIDQWQYDEALEKLRSALALNPRYRSGH